MKHENLILLILTLIIVIAPMVIYSGLGEDQGYFGGADDAGSDAVSETGYKPWFESFWIIIGYAVGYWKGQKKVE